jgi:hypothetical protein
VEPEYEVIQEFEKDGLKYEVILLRETTDYLRRVGGVVWAQPRLRVTKA